MERQGRESRVKSWPPATRGRGEAVGQAPGLTVAHESDMVLREGSHLGEDEGFSWKDSQGEVWWDTWRYRQRAVATGE